MGGQYDGMAQHCISVDWPAAYTWSARQYRRGYDGPISWMGSLIYKSRDASGLYYRRNRYYDSEKGQFTQEDPIGLAGGVNVYGFAEGDPVQYSDPYGLSAEASCPWCIPLLIGAARAAPYVAAAGKLLLEGLDPNPDMGSAIVSGGRFVASRTAHRAQETAAVAGRAWSTQRRAFWRAEAASEGAVDRWGAANVERMKTGRAAQYVDDAGEVRSVELHHEPVPKRDGGTRVRPVTREEHADVDPHRRLGPR